MSIQKAQYEEALAEYSNSLDAIALLRQYRPYLEMIPSMRRPDESVIAIPFPIVRLRGTTSVGSSVGAGAESICLPCDISILMCDPEWKIKTGVEIFIYIHRPQEDFSDLLSRWRQTQVHLSRGYEWDMPLRHRHIMSEGSDSTYPLFVIFEGTPGRVKRGLKGAYLPFVTRRSPESMTEENAVSSEIELLWSDDREDTLQ
ncbi:hypothetical protein OsccyDRAFT_2204 [Leptolyngbyaceae cyanobacterium JSC-12]|nr:hypothetical protein OsccyDRAFT_2204 [Leptolyngbyaceae cyanobacterium JSC-12]